MDHAERRAATLSLLRVGDVYDWEAVLRLIRESFAFMDARIDPPSSMHRLSVAELTAQAREGEVWGIEEAGQPVACVFLTEKPGRLYLGKLAVAASQRGRGLARRLVEQGVESCRARGLAVLELQVRVELVENQAAFAAMGFEKVGETAHDGFARPTSFTFQRRV
ncbi:GNAT family N-acetyltransferase [Thioclava sp. BHET1]|nr:GNAT family N-acetyltransferase [Thioclava sp. BHET1]